MAISQELGLLPPFLQRFLIDRGAVVDPDAVVPASSSVAPLFPPLPPRRIPLDNGGGGEDYSSTFSNIASTNGAFSPSINSDAFSRGFAELGKVPGQLGQELSNIGTDFMSIFNFAGDSVEKSDANKVSSGTGFDIGNILGFGSSDGPYEPPNALEQMTGNSLSFGGMGRTRQAIDAIGQARGDSPSFINGRKVATSMMPVLSAAGLGLGGSALGLFGGIFNAMGAHHDYNPNVDSNLFMDPDQGLVGFNSKSAGGGGMQEGMLNMTNMVEDMVNKGLGEEYINTPQGYIRANDLNDYFKTERDDEFGYGQLAYNGIPSGYEPSGYGDLSSNQAIDSLNNMSGDAWNSVASDVYASGGGYNDAVQAAENEAEALAEYQGWADFDDGSGGDEDSSAGGDEFGGFDDDFGFDD
tara:strand:+ start:4329 stop:5561 length:1233 start_codon:yes stop_codon:yes gene_type:complete